MYVCMYASKRICVCWLMFVLVHMYTHTYIHTHICIHVHMCIHMYVSQGPECETTHTWLQQRQVVDASHSRIVGLAHLHMIVGFHCCSNNWGTKQGTPVII